MEEEQLAVVVVLDPPENETGPSSEVHFGWVGNLVGNQLPLREDDNHLCLSPGLQTPMPLFHHLHLIIKDACDESKQDFLPEFSTASERTPSCLDLGRF